MAETRCAQPGHLHAGRQRVEEGFVIYIEVGDGYLFRERSEFESNLATVLSTNLITKV